jgi:flagellar motor switch protein FliN/FliY
MLQTSNREEPVLVAHLSVTAAGIQSPLMICLPFSILERFFTQGSNRLRGGRGGRPEHEQRQAEELVRSIGIEVVARFRPFRAPLDVLRQLQPGSTLVSPLAPNAPVMLFAAGTQIGEGQPGRAHGNLAVSCTSLHTEIIRQKTRRTALSSNAKAGATAHAMDLGELGTGAAPSGNAPLANLLHLMLPVTIELGQTRMTVQEILELGRGSVIQLERLVGEPVDVLVGDRLFAEGEVVVIGEQFGVRITKLAQGTEVAQA